MVTVFPLRTALIIPVAHGQHAVVDPQLLVAFEVFAQSKVQAVPDVFSAAMFLFWQKRRHIHAEPALCGIAYVKRQHLFDLALHLRPCGGRSGQCGKRPCEQCEPFRVVCELESVPIGFLQIARVVCFADISYHHGSKLQPLVGAVYIPLKRGRCFLFHVDLRYRM